MKNKMKDKEYYEQKNEAEQIKEDMDYEIIKDEKMTDKEQKQEVEK